MPPTIADLVERALAGFDALAVTAEPVDDEFQYVTDLGTVWRARLRAVAERPRRRAGAARCRRRDRRARRGGRLGSTTRTAPSTGCRRCPRSRWRRSARPPDASFADARPDGRAVVYAHIQADPLVAEAADLLAEATTTQRLLARAVMNGVSTDPAIWRAMFPTLFGPGGAGRRATPVRDRSEAILDVSLARRRPRRAGPQPVPRRHRRGADRAPARRADRSGAPRAPDPVRRPARPRSTRTTSPSSARPRPRPGTASGARAASRPTCSTSSTTRGAARPRTRRRCWSGLVVFDARRSCEVRLVRERGPVALEGLRLIALESLDRLAGGGSPRDRRRPRGGEPHGDRPVPGPVRRVRPGRPRADVGAAPLRAGRRLDPLRAAGVRPRLVRRAGPDLARARGGGRGRSAPIPLGTTLDVSTTVAGFRKVWARRRTDGRLADGTLAFWAHTDWVIVDARGAPDAHPGRVPGRLRRAARPVRARPGAAAADAGRRRRSIAVAVRPAGPRPAGPRQQRRLPRLPRGGVARRRAGGGRRGRAPRRGPSASSTCSRRSPGATVVTGAAWRGRRRATGDGARLGLAADRRRRRGPRPRPARLARGMPEYLRRRPGADRSGP